MLVASLAHAPKLTAVLNVRHLVLSLTRSWQETDRSKGDERILSQSSDADPEQLWLRAGALVNESSTDHVHLLLQRPVDLWTELFCGPFLNRITLTLMSKSADTRYSTMLIPVELGSSR
ncbi:unnamed protein product [Echinostoma caproni]|uniref:Secreted protein n=1 Tax=Echinostoma caproni TaxID=27848 RepID=A0A183AZD7_9TREM|nr:unnamed protein product [Echinostoma caproni]